MANETQIVAGKEQNRFYPYSDLFYVNRHSFFDAGQDSYTLPPAQQQDMFQILSNVEPVTQGVLQRRRGYTLFSNQTPPTPFQRAYAFRSEGLSLREYVWCSTSNVLATDEAGTTTLASIFTPSAGARNPRMALSRDYGYFADGVAADYKKWDGTGATNNLTLWGIDVTNSTGGGGNQGPFPPTVALTAGSGVPWSAPNNIFLEDGVFSIVNLTAGQTPQNLQAKGFNFTVPAIATITRVIVEIKCFGSGNLQPMNVTLLKNGSPIGATLQVTNIGTANHFITFTFSPAYWGYNWTPADINNANFGVNITTNTLPIGTYQVNVDFVRTTIIYTGGAGGGGSITVGVPTAGGNITLLSGRTYTYAFQNTKSGHVSNLGPASLTTGPLTNNMVPLSTIPTSNDPQVDTVLIFATADGNDQTTLFLLATLPNGTSTYTDNTPDGLTATVPTGPALLSNQVFQQTDQFGVLHGIANNNLPPTADFPVKHKGRIYMALGHTLYFSKNLDEVTTSTGTITSKWEEAWPATNQIDISEQAETVKALISDGETLWIGTERNIRRLIGDSPQNFQKPEVQFNECGVVSPEVWKVVFYEGQPVGTMWLTPDFRVMASDFNTYQDVGTPIQNVLSSINLAAVANAHAAFVSQAAFDLYMLYIPTGLNTTPDTICIFNMRSKKWSIWQPTDLITSSLFNINASGFPQWLFASGAGPIYFWDANVNQDRNGNGPISYPVTIQTSWLDFGDYNIRKFVNQIIPTTSDALALTVQVDGASNEQDFFSPLSVVGPTTVIPASIPNDVFVPLASGPSHNRAFRFTFVSPPSTIKNVLTGYAIESGVFHRY